MFTNTVWISKPHRSFIRIWQIQVTSRAWLLMANYTTYEREQRCSLTTTHHRATSRKLMPVSEDAVSLGLEPLSVHSTLPSCSHLWNPTDMSHVLFLCPQVCGDAEVASFSSTSRGNMNELKLSKEHIYIYTQCIRACECILTQKLQVLWSSELQTSIKLEIKWRSTWLQSHSHVS